MLTLLIVNYDTLVVTTSIENYSTLFNIEKHVKIK